MRKPKTLAGGLVMVVVAGLAVTGLVVAARTMSDAAPATKRR